MTMSTLLRSAGLLLALGTLAACNSTNPTATATPTPTPTPTTSTPAMTVATSGMTGTTSTNTAASAFDTSFDAANTLAATTTPITGSASYTGQVEVHTTASTTDPDNVVFGDVAMDVDFDGGVNPITASVSNIEGRIGGEDTAVAGTLTHIPGSGINQVLALPVAGTTATSIAVQVEGALADPTGTLTGDARMVITGTARGANGASISGANSVAITETGGGANRLNTGGRFYVNR